MRFWEDRRMTLLRFLKLIQKNYTVFHLYYYKKNKCHKKLYIFPTLINDTFKRIIIHKDFGKFQNYADYGRVYLWYGAIL